MGKDVANTYDSFLRFVRFYKIDEGVLGGVSNALVSLGTMRDVGAWAPRGGCVGLGIDLRATPPTDVVKIKTIRLQARNCRKVYETQTADTLSLNEL